MLRLVGSLHSGIGKTTVFLRSWRSKTSDRETGDVMQNKSSLRGMHFKDDCWSAIRIGWLVDVEVMRLAGLPNVDGR